MYFVVGSVATAGDGCGVREELGKQRCQAFGYEVEGSLSSWMCPAGQELPGGTLAGHSPSATWAQSSLGRLGGWFRTQLCVGSPIVTLFEGGLCSSAQKVAAADSRHLQELSGGPDLVVRGPPSGAWIHPLGGMWGPNLHQSAPPGSHQLLLPSGDHIPAIGPAPATLLFWRSPGRTETTDRHP